MNLDVLYLCHGRLEFTKATLPRLLETTDWSLVDELVVYNDATPEDDRATTAFVMAMLAEAGVGTFRQTNLGSPVAVMNHYLQRATAEMFAKIDNDIIVDDAWLSALLSVMSEWPQLQLLGMEPGMSGLRAIDDPLATQLYGYTDCSHIGGVGLMRRQVFKMYGRPVANGRFGFTEWQHQFQPQRGWIAPDLRTFALDRVPVEPWVSLTARYKRTEGLQRDWPLYEDAAIYDWWTNGGT